MKGKITITVEENGSISGNIDAENLRSDTCFALIQTLSEIITDISGAMASYDNDSETTCLEVE